jgi:Putative adhesin
MKKAINILKRGFPIILLLPLSLFAQTTLQVVTKSVEKTFTDAPTLQIEAEKADIELITWEKSEIKVSIELVAKHPDRKVATADLEMMKYVADKIGKGVFLRNYLVIENPKFKPTSNLKAKYTIKVPHDLSITIQNSFGKINIKGDAKVLNLKTDFCNIDLNQLNGNVKLDLHYGEIVINNMKAKLNLISERSDLTINDLGGDSFIKTEYGKLQINTIRDLKKLEIDAQKTEVTLIGVTLKNHEFTLLSSYGKLKIPPEFSLVENSKTYKVAVFNTQAKSKIKIKNSFGDINITN